MTPVAAPLLALVAAYGVFLLYTAAVLGWRGLGVGPRVDGGRRSRRRVREWMIQGGLGDIRVADLLGVCAALCLVGVGLAWALFGGTAAPVIAGAFAATAPVLGARTRRHRRRLLAREAWPRLLEEIRLQATTLGRSIPQALFTAGATAPQELRPAFTAAHREWLLSTDFGRTIGVLKARLADATVDAVCETLLVAYEVGGSEVDRRLVALIEDRSADLQGRKDAEARQAGARFARRFVLLVPLGMALAGLTIGHGRAAYETPLGQALVTAGLVLVAACWLWAGRVMRLPGEQRVFGEGAA